MDRDQLDSRRLKTGDDVLTSTAKALPSAAADAETTRTPGTPTRRLLRTGADRREVVRPVTASSVGSRTAGSYALRNGSASPAASTPKSVPGRVRSSGPRGGRFLYRRCAPGPARVAARKAPAAVIPAVAGPPGTRPAAATSRGRQHRDADEQRQAPTPTKHRRGAGREARDETVSDQHPRHRPRAVRSGNVSNGVGIVPNLDRLRWRVVGLMRLLITCRGGN